MSKPKHYCRGKARYLGYGYSTTDLNKRKGAWLYVDYLTNEIEDNKHKGGVLIEKLRKYLKRSQAMTTNQTIDGVPRALLQSLYTDTVHQWGVGGNAAGQLRALLDAPAPITSAIGHIEQRRSMGLAIGSPITNVVWDIPHPELQRLPDGAKVYLRPAAQFQGEPVAYDQAKENKLFEDWARTQSDVSLRLCDIGLYYQRDTGLAHDAWQHRAKLAEQPAPVAVVMPERADASNGSHDHQSGWNACLDELERLNTTRPSHGNPPPGTEPCGTHHDNDGLDEWRNCNRGGKPCPANGK